MFLKHLHSYILITACTYQAADIVTEAELAQEVEAESGAKRPAAAGGGAAAEKKIKST